MIKKIIFAIYVLIGTNFINCAVNNDIQNIESICNEIVNLTKLLYQDSYDNRIINARFSEHDKRALFDLFLNDEVDSDLFDALGFENPKLNIYLDRLKSLSNLKYKLVGLLSNIHTVDERILKAIEKTLDRSFVDYSKISKSTSHNFMCNTFHYYSYDFQIMFLLAIKHQKSLNIVNEEILYMMQQTTHQITIDGRLLYQLKSKSICDIIIELRDIAKYLFDNCKIDLLYKLQHYLDDYLDWYGQVNLLYLIFQDSDTNLTTNYNYSSKMQLLPLAKLYLKKIGLYNQEKLDNFYKMLKKNRAIAYEIDNEGKNLLCYVLEKKAHYNIVSLLVQLNPNALTIAIKNDPENLIKFINLVKPIYESKLLAKQLEKDLEESILKEIDFGDSYCSIM